MCTAVSYKTKDHYFGRSLDLDMSFNEMITISPRNFPFRFKKVKDLNRHYAMIGVAFVVDNYPLYYDAFNEKGLSIAGLNFPGNADYKLEVKGKDNVTPFEFIPWIMGQCATTQDAKEKIKGINFLNVNFNKDLSLTPLHWMISDRESSIVVEPLKDGLKVYDNPVGVMTNNPSFDIQIFNLNKYMSLSPQAPVNCFSKSLDLEPYSFGMGAIGLPGDLSSESRFVKAAFTKMNSVCGNSESDSISQFFHILESVFQTKGCVCLGDDKYQTTIYMSCCNVDKGIYYYKTYDNSQISAVNMYKVPLEGHMLKTYPLLRGQHIRMQN